MGRGEGRSPGRSRNGGPPRQGEERGGRRGSPQALTGGVSALRLLHELVGWASGEREISRWGVTFGRGEVRSGGCLLRGCRLRCVVRSVVRGSLSGGLCVAAGAG